MTQPTTPAISVIMSTYNDAQYIREAVDSILEQSFTDFEFIVVNDGSTDGTSEILASYDDPRLRIIDNGENKGVAYSWNTALDAAKGKYAVRMDADDISVSERLDKLHGFMEQNPGVDICGSGLKLFGSQEYSCCYSDDDGVIKATHVFNSQLPHATVIMRLATIRQHGLRYKGEYNGAVDCKFFADAFQAPGLTVSNIPDVLYHYRRHKASVTNAGMNASRQSGNRVRLEMLKELGIEPNKEQRRLHELLTFRYPFASLDDIMATYRWCKRLEAAAKKDGSPYDPKTFRRITGQRFNASLEKQMLTGFYALWFRFFSSYAFCCRFPLIRGLQHLWNRGFGVCWRLISGKLDK